MTKDVEHFFKCFLAFDIPQLRILCLALYPIFLTQLFGSLESIFLSSWYILDISLLSDVGLVKIFSQSVGCHFVLLTVSVLQKNFQHFFGLVWFGLVWFGFLRQSIYV